MSRPPGRIWPLLGLGLVVCGCESPDPTLDLQARLDELRIVEPRRSGPVNHHECSTDADPTRPRLCSDSIARRDVSDWISLVEAVERTIDSSNPPPVGLRVLGDSTR